MYVLLQLRMMDGEQGGPTVCVLLGAGASFEAGCPLVTQLAESFVAHLEESGDQEELDAFRWIHERLIIRFPNADIERVLASLRELERADEHVFSAFVNQNGWAAEVGKFRRKRLFNGLSRRLEDHIRHKCEVQRGAVDYLRPLRDLVPPGGALDVFTLNYDYSVELMCQESGIPYTDGFTVYWDPGQFERKDIEIRLHKLHGSLLWYETSRPPRRLVKIPTRASSSGEVRFFSDDNVATSVIYPTLVKEQHVEPYATLLARFRDCLRTADLLVVIGYSFRDRYLKDLILEKVHENPRLRLMVVDPYAADVLRTSDETVGGTWEFGRVRERIHLVRSGARDAMAHGALLRRIRSSAEGRFFARRADELRLVAGRADERRQVAAKAIAHLLEAADYGALYGLLEHDEEREWHRALRQMESTTASGLVARLFELVSASRRDEESFSSFVRRLFLRLARFTAFRNERGDIQFIGEPFEWGESCNLSRINEWAQARLDDIAIDPRGLVEALDDASWHLTKDGERYGRELCKDLELFRMYWADTRSSSTHYDVKALSRYGSISAKKVQIPVPTDKGYFEKLSARFAADNQAPAWLVQE